MGPFEYSHSFSVDEAIMRRYSDNSEWSGSIVIEIRIKFIVKANSISGERILIDSESYATGAGEKHNYVESCIRWRLSDCWMSDPHIRTISKQLFLFAKQIRATGRRGKIPVAVDVEVCTLQKEGEAMTAAVERAMRPDILPPLYLYPMSGIGKPSPMRPLRGIRFFKMSVPTVRVVEVENASSDMDLCRICGGKPAVGTQISTLPCGHAFHYHCCARQLLLESNSCPSCHYQPACHYQSGFNPYDDSTGDPLKAFMRDLLDSDDDDDDYTSDDDDDYPAQHDPDLDDF